MVAWNDKAADLEQVGNQEQMQQQGTPGGTVEMV